jgi:IS5 family transposase
VRTTIAKQADLFAPAVEHQLSKELEQIHEVLIEHPEWIRWAHRDLTRAQGVSARKGRAGMSASMVLRVGLLKHRLDMSLRRLAPLLADSLSLREFVGLSSWDPTPKRSTLQENLAKIRPETWGKILRGVVVSAEAQAYEDGNEARIDCTVVATNVHPPSDSALLWDCVRVLTRVMRRSRELFAVEFEDHRKAAKRLHTKIYWARKKAQRVPAYGAFLDVAAKVDTEVARVVSQLKAFKGDCLHLLEELHTYRGFLARVIDQTRRRVIEGETVPAHEKLFSIFEPETDMIAKGRRRPQFGHKVAITAGRSGLVLDCVIERGNPADATLTLRQLERLTELRGEAPRDAILDGGFASRANLEGAKALGVERCVFSKSRGLSKEEMAGSRRTFGRLKNRRAGIEGIISRLKRAFGLRRCTWKSWRRFQSYVWSAVVAANLSKLARLRLGVT